MLKFYLPVTVTVWSRHIMSYTTWTTRLWVQAPKYGHMFVLSLHADVLLWADAPVHEALPTRIRISNPCQKTPPATLEWTITGMWKIHGNHKSKECGSIPVFQVMTLCFWVSGSWCFKGICCPNFSRGSRSLKDEGNTFLKKCWEPLTNRCSITPHRLESSIIPL
jgi:hypothetical protein